MSRKLRKTILFAAAAILVTAIALHATPIIVIDPGDPGGGGGSSATTSTRPVAMDYTIAEWGVSGGDTLVAEMDANGTVTGMTLKAADGTVLDHVTRAEADAAGSGSYLAAPACMQASTGLPSGTFSVQGTNSFGFTQPITSIYNSSVTVTGHVKF